MLVGECFANVGKRKTGLKSGYITHAAKEQFAQGRMNIEKILSGKIAGDEFAEVHFIENGLIRVPEKGKMG